MSNVIEKKLTPEEALKMKRKWIPADQVIKKLEQIKNDPKSWKEGGIGGQDQYAGMPPFLRVIDEIIQMLK